MVVVTSTQSPQTWYKQWCSRLHRWCLVGCSFSSVWNWWVVDVCKWCTHPTDQGLIEFLGIQRGKFEAGGGKTGWTITIIWFDGGACQRVFKCFENRGGLNELECKMRKKVWGKIFLMRMTSELALAEAEWRWCRKLHQAGATQHQVLLNMVSRVIVYSRTFYSSLIGTEVPQRVDPPEIRDLSLFFLFLTELKHFIIQPFLFFFNC